MVPHSLFSEEEIIRNLLAIFFDSLLFFFSMLFQPVKADSDLILTSARRYTP
jgi:hypothetical protein